jgi:hypothetical protein
MTENEINALSLSELVTVYNTHSGKPPIKKFSDRKTGVLRVLSVVGIPATPEQLVVRHFPVSGATTLKFNSAPPPVGKVVSGFKAPEKKVPKEKALATKVEKKAAAKVKAKRAAIDLGEAQRITWQDDAVRTARSERSAVLVDKTEYKSVRAAFEALGLPMSQHIKFRGELKESIKLTRYEHKWEIVPINY